MTEHDDITGLLERHAETVPPPRDTDVQDVLRAGRRRRRVRQGSYVVAAVVLLVVATGVGVQQRSRPGPVTPPEITEPFGPSFARVTVCEPDLAEGCQPVSEGTLGSVTGLVSGSPVAEVIEIRDPEQVAAATDDLDDPDGDSPPSDSDVQAAPTEVILRIAETQDPRPLFRNLAGLAGTDGIALGTATEPPTPGTQLPPDDEAAAPQTTPTQYASLDAPVAGTDQTVTFTTSRNDIGNLCVATENSPMCLWTPIGPGILWSFGWPTTIDDTPVRCVDHLVGYDVASVAIELADGTTVPTATVSARPDLPWLRLVAGCWTGPAQSFTTIAYGPDGNQVDQQEIDAVRGTPQEDL